MEEKNSDWVYNENFNLLKHLIVPEDNELKLFCSFVHCIKQLTK